MVAYVIFKKNVFLSYIATLNKLGSHIQKLRAYSVERNIIKVNWTIKLTTLSQFEAVKTIKLLFQQTLKPYTTDMIINTLFVNLTTSEC